MSGKEIIHGTGISLHSVIDLSLYAYQNKANYRDKDARLEELRASLADRRALEDI